MDRYKKPGSLTGFFCCLAGGVQQVLPLIAPDNPDNVLKLHRGALLWRYKIQSTEAGI